MMNTAEMERLSDVWREVRQWPVSARLSLASKILRSLEAETAVANRERQSLSDLIGAWKTEPPPSDEEVERILDDERMRKYG